VQALVPQLDGESRRAHAERILAITRRLADLHIPATSENVRDSIAAIQNAREHYRNQPVFNDTVLFAAGAVTSSPDSGESVYITPEIRRRLSELGVEVKYFSGLLSERQNCDWATPESLENARANVLEAVAETETPITLMFRMHGNEKFLEFGATGFSNQRAAHQTVAFARDIAHAFAERYANPERMAAARRTPDVIIFDDCNIQPFAMDALMREIRAIAEEEHREIPIPSIITSSEQGQYAFRGQLMNRLLFEQNRRTPTFGMLYPDNDLLGSRSINSNAVVMTRDRRNRPLQIG
jgi:hypothetical protein